MQNPIDIKARITGLLKDWSHNTTAQVAAPETYYQITKALVKETTQRGKRLVVGRVISKKVMEANKNYKNL